MLNSGDACLSAACTTRGATPAFVRSVPCECRKLWMHAVLPRSSRFAKRRATPLRPFVSLPRVVDEEDRASCQPSEPVAGLDVTPHVLRGVLVATGHRARERVHNDEPRLDRHRLDPLDQMFEPLRIEERERVTEDDELLFQPGAVLLLIEAELLHPGLRALAHAVETLGCDVENRS